MHSPSSPGSPVMWAVFSLVLYFSPGATPSTGVASTCNKAADLAIAMGNCPSEKRGECQDTPSRASVTYLIICVLLEYCNFEDDMLSYQSCCIMCCLPCVLLLFTLLACCVCVLGYFVLLTLFCFALRCFAFAYTLGCLRWVACLLFKDAAILFQEKLYSQAQAQLAIPCHNSKHKHAHKDICASPFKNARKAT